MKRLAGRFEAMPAPRHCSVIRRHRRANDLGKVAQDRPSLPVERQRIQLVERVEEGVNYVVPDLGLSHRVNDRRQHVRDGRDRDAVAPPRFPVLHHARGIAA